MGVPPNQGRIILLMIGWTWKSKNALTKIVAAAHAAKPARRPEGAEASVAGSETAGVCSVFGAGGDFGWGVLSDAVRRRIRKRLRVVDPFIEARY